jgi:hypothetical protein
MYVSELNFERPISEQKVLDAVDSSTGTRTGISLRTELNQGDFPFLVRVTIPAATQAPTLEQFLSIARELRTILLTDDVAVDELWDDGYSLISPDGFTAVVRADEAGLDAGNIVLHPESRDLYRSVSTRLSNAAD